MLCLKCNSKIPEDSEFCPNCGVKVENKIVVEKNISEVGKNKKVKESKHKFCKSCGGEINYTTNKCSSCGKQYFRFPGFKINKKLLLYVMTGLIIVALIVFNIFQYINYKKDEGNYISKVSNLTDNNEVLNKRLKAANSYNDALEIENNTFKRKADFMDESIVFRIQGYGNYYYTYDAMMEKVGYSSYSFWAYNIEAAKSLGYRQGN